MGVFCDMLKYGSTAALNCLTGQNKGRYRKKELLLLLVSLGKSNGKGLVEIQIQSRLSFISDQWTDRRTENVSYILCNSSMQMNEKREEIYFLTFPACF